MLPFFLRCNHKGSFFKYIHMKKVFIIVSLVLTGITANAQWYAGGSLNFGTATDKDNDGNKQNTVTSFGLSPEIGYYLNDRFDIGLAFGIGTASTKNHTADTKRTITTWSVAPYVRYSFIQFGKFEVIGRGSLSVEGAKAKDESDNEIKSTTFGINITPVLAYNLTDHLTLQTGLNFASIGFNSTNVKDGGSENGFNFGFDSTDVTTLGDITVGFIYKF